MLGLRTCMRPPPGSHTHSGRSLVFLFFCFFGLNPKNFVEQQECMPTKRERFYRMPAQSALTVSTLRSRTRFQNWVYVMSLSFSGRLSHTGSSSGKDRMW